MNKLLRRTWAEINLNALESNINEIKKACHGKEIMAVVKANAYGHDDKIVCTELSRLGIKYFAVSNVWEAEDLRSIVKDGEILVFGYTEQEFMDSIVTNNLIHTVGSLEYAKELNDFALKNNTKIRIHIKINTGMSRVGIDTLEDFNQIMSFEGLKPEGAYTHFAVSDSLDAESIKYTVSQHNKLMEIAKNRGLLIHSQNSGGILYHDNFEADIVRAGIIIYGCSPNTGENVPIKLHQVMSLRSAICQIKEVDNNIDISYGRTFTTKRKSRLAIVPVGYADGYRRELSGRGVVSVNNVLAPVLGRVCMDQIIVDVTDIPTAKVGDIVDIYSENNKETSIDYISDILGTISYELACGVGHRVPRVGVKNGEIVEVERYG